MRMNCRLLMMIAALFIAGPTQVVLGDEGPILITVAGNIEQANRGGRDDFTDAFIRFRDKTFDKALALDGSVLAKLKQQAIVANAEKWPGAMSLEGPLLNDVLALAGASGRTILVMALDGYEIELTPSDLEDHTWVLATHLDGKSLGIGGRGPLWLIYDTSGRKASGDEEARWVWSAFFIEVK